VCLTLSTTQAFQRACRQPPQCKTLVFAAQHGSYEGQRTARV
jgi:hypothetical protein